MTANFLVRLALDWRSDKGDWGLRSSMRSMSSGDTVLRQLA